MLLKNHLFFILFISLLFCSGISPLFCIPMPADSTCVTGDSAFVVMDTCTSSDNLINKESIGGVFNVTPLKHIKNAAITGVNDAWALVKSPLQWDSTSFFVYPSIVLATYFLMIIDEPVTNAIAGNGKYKDSKWIKATEFYGRNSTSELAAAGFTLTGIVLNDDDIARIGLEIYESYFFANNIHSIVKRMFGRSRPFEEKGTTDFNPFPDRKNPLNSFPSGHATLSFSLSTVLAKHVDNTYLKILCYAPAVLTCFSRVYQEMHWGSDVFLGAAVGYLVGNFVVNRHSSAEQDFFSLGFDEQGRVSFVVPLR